MNADRFADLEWSGTVPTVSTHAPILSEGVAYDYRRVVRELEAPIYAPWVAPMRPGVTVVPATTDRPATGYVGTHRAGRTWARIVRLVNGARTYVPR